MLSEILEYCDAHISNSRSHLFAVMPSPQHFDGHAMASWNELDITIAVPWYIGLMFRTRQTSGSATLMQVNAGDTSQINLLVNV